MPPVDLMKTSLDHLPAKKARELARIQEILFEEFRVAVAAHPPDITKSPEVLKVVLFGSYARGDWVDEKTSLPDGYQSDYDLLIVVNHKALTDMATYWYPAEERLIRVAMDATPFSLIVHSLGEINESLQRGRYFFLDIVRDGILLYDKPGHPFRKPKPLAPAAALEEAQEAFDVWFPLALGFIRHFESDLKDAQLKLGAFELHQAVESLCTAYLLVKTFYVPKTHNLNKLRCLAEGENPRFREVWPTGARGGRRAFERLKDAYVKARYSRHYVIEMDELVWLGERVGVLRDLVKVLCEERLAELKAAVESS